MNRLVSCIGVFKYSNHEQDEINRFFTCKSIFQFSNHKNNRRVTCKAYSNISTMLLTDMLLLKVFCPIIQQCNEQTCYM